MGLKVDEPKDNENKSVMHQLFNFKYVTPDDIKMLKVVSMVIMLAALVLVGLMVHSAKVVSNCERELDAWITGFAGEPGGSCFFGLMFPRQIVFC